MNVEQIFSDAELEYLQGIVIAFIEEGFMTPPYDAELYSIIAKLGIKQTDLTQSCNIALPAVA